MARAAKPNLDDVLGEPETRQTLSAIVASRLRRLIVTGQLEAGTPLRLSAIATKLGVSVMPVREALRNLESEGLVVVEPHRGACVAGLSLEDVEELYAMRAALESLAARVATTRLTVVDQQEVSELFRHMERDEALGDLSGFIEHDRAFHKRLYESSGRPRLAQHIQDLLESSARARPLVFRAWQPLSIALEEHRLILEAVRIGDAQLAEKRTREHLGQAARRVIESLRAGDTPEASDPAGAGDGSSL